MGQVRDYGEIVRRLAALSRRDWRVDEIGHVSGYPFFSLTRSVSVRAPTILLTAGIHGEEPGGVEGALRWLESGEWARWRINWLVLPCINPYGWERNQRRNAQRYDINRQFRHPSVCPEAELVTRLVRDRRFVAMVDLHEDVDSTGYYLYELLREPPYIGERIIRAVSKIIPLNRHKVIDGSHATGMALIRREASTQALVRRKRWPMAYHVFLHCTEHVVGSETPVRFPLEQRAKAHNVAIRTALQALLK